MKYQIWVTTLTVCLAAVPGLRAGELRAGAAAVEITPPLGVPMAGYYHERAAEGVHDPLYSKAIVLEKDGVKAALVALDLISTTRGLVEDARREIAEATGVPGSRVMISATHAHTGPVISDRSARVDALGGGKELAVRYRAELPGRIAESVRLAEKNLAPARAAAAIGREETLAFNRRFHMKDGSVGWNPGKLNPNIVLPAGPIDPDVPVVFFETAEGKPGEGKPLATYVNYAMHLDTVGGLEISADFPCTLSRILAGAKGEGMVTMFTIGCAGDINHIDVGWSERQKGHGEAARIGAILAAAALKAFRGLEPVEAERLRVRSATVELPLPELAGGAVEAARAVIARRDGEPAARPSFLETVDAFKTLDVAARDGKPHAVEVQVIALGREVAWVSLPGEIFVELGLSIREHSPFPHTIIAELANGSIGYIPTRRAWPHGNYEVVSARCAEGSGELLVDAALRLLRELHEGE